MLTKVLEDDAASNDIARRARSPETAETATPKGAGWRLFPTYFMTAYRSRNRCVLLAGDIELATLDFLVWAETIGAIEA